jgi:ubiquinone/menaquinone biosynthesis C-methylase UbiE
LGAENPFETRYREYDAWFDANQNAFASELAAVRAALPAAASRAYRWVEIGVGSGRFASNLGIPIGVEPAEGIATLAEARGIEVVKGVAEDLPLDDGSIGAAFLITSLCFIDEMERAFAEVARVLIPGGSAIEAFIPADSPFGRLYETAGKDDPFFRRAKLRPRRGVLAALAEAGLHVERAVHTLTSEPARANDRVESPSDGWRGGSFVVVRAVKPGSVRSWRKR